MKPDTYDLIHPVVYWDIFKLIDFFVTKIKMASLSSQYKIAITNYICYKNHFWDILMEKICDNCAQDDGKDVQAEDHDIFDDISDFSQVSS